MDPEFIYGVVGLVSAVGGAGGAWGAAHVRIKHAEHKLRDIEEELENHDERTRNITIKLARIEALLEQIDKRIQ